MITMSKNGRINAVINGEPVDRVPASFWRHFYEYEDTAKNMADAMLRYQENYDWDFMKINPRASYHHEDWGASYKFFKDGITKPERLDYPVKKISDLAKIRPLDPIKDAPVLRDHIDAVYYIRKNLHKSVYSLMTVFSPLSIVGDMTENRDKLSEYILEDPGLVKTAVESVTQTFEIFVTELLNAGVSGIFYATTHWGHYGRLTDELFDEFSRPYDMRILKHVQDAHFNVLHICKGRNMLAKLADYPVHAFSWDTTDPTNISLAEGREVTGKAVIGGIDHNKTLLTGSPDECKKEAENGLKQTKGIGWIMGAGCTYEPETPSENLKALREWVDKVPMSMVK